MERRRICGIGSKGFPGGRREKKTTHERARELSRWDHGICGFNQDERLPGYNKYNHPRERTFAKAGSDNIRNIYTVVS